MVFADPGIGSHHAIGSNIVVADPLALLHDAPVVEVIPLARILDPAGLHLA